MRGYVQDKVIIATVSPLRSQDGNGAVLIIA